MTRQTSLLIVDDRRDNLLILESLIKEHFPTIQIIAASDAAEGLRLASEQQVDGALLDVQMPQMDGIEMCRRLKAAEETRYTSVILLTSHRTSPELRMQGLEAGADDFIHRPFDNLEFVARVKVMLRVKRAEDELRSTNQRLQEQVAEQLGELRTSEQKYRALYDNAPLSYQSVNENGDLLDVNPAWLRTLGYARDEVIGQPYSSFLLSDQMAYFERTFAEFKRHGFVKNAIFKLRHKNGHYLDVSLDGCIGHRPDGSFHQTYCVFQDITARREAEEERELLMSAIEQAAEVIVITDRDSRILYVNPAFEQVTGYSRAEVVGRKPNLMKSGQHDEKFYRELWNTLERGQTWSGRFVNMKKDGTLYTEDAMISPVHDATGKTINYVAVKRDISQEIDLENQLHQSQKMEAVGKLAGGIAHDFNNMLGVILGSAELARLQIDPTDKIAPNLEAIQKAAERSADLTRQLLAFSRKQTLEPKVINLNEQLNSMESMLRRLIGEDIDLLTVYADDLESTEADPGQVQQIIMNLAVNGRDAMPEGGKLAIETANAVLDEHYAKNHLDIEPGHYVMLAVTDTGCGMDEKTRLRIFEPFFTTKELGKGTGLGLSTVYGIAKQSGGYIWCYSEPGQGTTFKIYLPRSEAQPVREPSRDDTRLFHGKNQHILVVEDETPVRHMLEKMFRELQYQVTGVENAEQALQLIEQDSVRPDLIITDVVMPGMGGKQLVERVRQLLPEQKVLYMSGYTDNSIVHQGVLDASAPFLQKPFTLRDVAAKIHQVLTADERA